MSGRRCMLYYLLHTNTCYIFTNFLVEEDAVEKLSLKDVNIDKRFIPQSYMYTYETPMTLVDYFSGDCNQKILLALKVNHSNFAKYKNRHNHSIR